MEQDLSVQSEEQPQELQEPVEDNAQVEGEDLEVTDNESNEVSENEPQATEEVIEEEEEEDNYNPANYQQEQYEIPQIPQIDPNTFIDESGQVDWLAYNQAQENRIQAVQQQAYALSQQAVQQATQAMQAQQQYAKDWSKADEVLPEMKKDKELRDLVQSFHAQSAVPGKKYLSPAKAAAKVKAMLSGREAQGKANGIKTAQETRTVQSAASLATPNPPAQSETNVSGSLKEKMRSGKTAAERKQASLGLISEMIKKGQL